ncbi:MAG: methionyl-tRNA formyltransferase [Bacteroidetes bacterium]|nr:methionyl-tRNA formyltransferase [Bacteroidota bacterium]
MRLVFMGTPDFAVPSLRALHAAGYEIVRVVTSPDKPRGRGRQMSPTPVKVAALELGLPVFEAHDLHDPAFADILREDAADLFVIVAFRILPESVFTLPRIGSFNLHASLLPRYRGAAPINWVLMRGDTESGVTTFFLQKKVDTGGILLQRRVPLHENMSAGELHDLLAAVGAEAVVDTVRGIEGGTLETRPQEDSRATTAPKIFRESCEVPWAKSAREVHDHIRGLSPHPAAWSMLDGKEMKLLESRVAEEQSHGAPGTIVATAPELLVQCGRGTVALHVIKPEGKKAMSAEEYLRGHRIASDARFGGGEG